MKAMHVGSIDNRESVPARILLELEFAGYEGRTTAELQRLTGSMAVSTDISAIRQQLAGHPRFSDVKCAYQGESENGRKVYRYHLVPRGQLSLI